MTEKLHRHHKVPTFLGGADETWNIEYITEQEHIQRHLDIAEELNTPRCWQIVIYMIARFDGSNFDRAHICRMFAKSQQGINNVNYGNTGRKSASFAGLYYTPHGVFESQRLGAHALDISRELFRDRIKSKTATFKEWWFQPKEEL